MSKSHMHEHIIEAGEIAEAVLRTAAEIEQFREAGADVQAAERLFNAARAHYLGCLDEVLGLLENEIPFHREVA